MFYYFMFAFAILSIIVFRSINFRDPLPVLGVYKQPGKWYYWKFTLFYSLLTLRKVTNKLRRNNEGDNAGYRTKSRSCVENMDCSQTLSEDPKAIDAVYFNAASKDGCFLVGGTARRPNGIVNGFLYLKVPAVGLLLSPKLPDTTLQQTEDEQSNAVYGAEGLRFEPLEPMKQWHITYNGKMKSFEDSTKTFDVQLEAEWTTKLPYFDFDTDMHPAPISRALAKEKWSKQYFETLKMAHQTHYEQHGDISGHVTIDGKRFPLHLNSMRDHSYGYKREWRNFHRYALHMATLQDGTRFCVGIVSSPLSFSSMELGYLYTPEGRLVPVKSCDIQLYEFGENGTPPLDYAFNFTAGSATYRVHVKVEHSPIFYIGDDWEAKVVERMASFTVNGLKGWGCAEWEYRNLNGKNYLNGTDTI